MIIGHFYFYVENSVPFFVEIKYGVRRLATAHVTQTVDSGTVEIMNSVQSKYKRYVVRACVW
jgi:hypothetical protein